VFNIIIGKVIKWLERTLGNENVAAYADDVVVFLRKREMKGMIRKII